jgi:tetratricopeptide (TPR) repeat protein
MSQRKKINVQNAKGDIVNVAGNLNLNGGTLQIEKLFIEDQEDLDQRILQAEQQSLSLQFSISYFDAVRKSFAGKSLIERSLLSSLWGQLNQHRQVLLVGQPGAGKTCIFLQLEKFCVPIYISLRDRSPAFLLSYLVNKIRISKSDPLIKIQDVESGLAILETQLQDSTAVFFIDDLEANTDFALQLMALIKGDNLFLYASRNEKELQSAGIHPVRLPALDQDEAKAFLTLQGMDISILEFAELYLASEGNPLYLFYFSKFQIKPLPQNIQSYHQSIWTRLENEAKECLIFCSLSYLPLLLEDLAALWNKSSVEVVSNIAAFSGLLTNQDGNLTLFHPLFREFVSERIQTDGLAPDYKRRLADFYLSREKYLNAAVMLVDEDPTKFNKFGESCIAPAISIGDLPLAIRFIKTLLQFPKTRFLEGYLRYHLAYVNRYLYLEEDANKELENAIVLFKKLRNKKWLLTAQMIKAMNLVENGEKEEGLQLAETIMEKSKKFGHAFHARNLVNLTKIYMDISEYNKAADAGKQAFDLFEQMNEPEGMIASLANLASSLAHLNDHLELAEKYALKILSLSGNGVEFGLRMIALNILTSINRRKKDFATAKQYGEQAIHLCRQHQLPDKVILNLINYGNIIRDEGDLLTAVKIYEEALVLINEIKLKKEEARIYWILISLYRQKNEMEVSLAYADKAINTAQKANHTYGLAHAWEEKAKTLYIMDRDREAAEAYETSARIFSSIAQYSNDTRQCFLQAIDLYFKTGDTQKGNELLSEAIRDHPQVNAGELADLLMGDGLHNEPATIHISFLQLAKRYMAENFDENAIRKFLVYNNYCHRNMGSSKIQYNDVLEQLASATSANRFARTILAILLEQSRELTQEEALSKIIAIVSRSLGGFYYRETTEQSVFTTAVTDKLHLQLFAFKSDVLAKKMALVMLLFLFAAPELIDIPDSCATNFYTAILMNRREIENEGPELDLSEEFSVDIQTLQMRTNRARMVDTILINNDYQACADLETFPDNKCLMYYLGMFTIGIASHFAGMAVDSTPSDTKPITRKLAFFFDYTSLEDAKISNMAFEVDIQKIK